MLYILLTLQIITLGVVFTLIFRKPAGPSAQDIATLSGEIERLGRLFKDELSIIRTEIQSQNQANREELQKALGEAAMNQHKQALDTRNELSSNLGELREQITRDATQNRDELAKTLNNLSESLSRKVAELSQITGEQSEKLRQSVEERLEKIRSGNESKLEEMRKTVDEKLHATLEKRLGESFTQVSQRLEEVHKGLGEMKNLATGVGDLKRTLEGVKPRGILGELQLANLLAEILTPEQYEVNFKPRPRSQEVVEYAIALPGPEEGDSRVYLPIDAKFPLQDYQNMLDAYDAGNLAEYQLHQKALVANIKSSARDIRDKYINPPLTTDFALLFLPFESLYGETLRISGLFELIQREYRVILCGPTTLAALLNSLQMGFKTLAIQKKSSEVWKLLVSVKKEFGTFGDVLEKAKKKIEAAGNELDNATNRSRMIERRLDKVEVLEVDEQAQLPDE
ncbi:MAG: DNA recombination protein RmuC [Candidatus Cloacimonadaceae bacterium]